MDKKIRYIFSYKLTGEESMKLQELSKKLKLGKSETIGLLIMKAQIIETPGKKTKLLDESLIIQDDLTDLTL